MIAVGTPVRILPPFEVDADLALVVVGVQHVTADGLIVDEPADSIQYLIAGLSDEPMAFAPQHVEALP